MSSSFCMIDIQIAAERFPKKSYKQGRFLGKEQEKRRNSNEFPVSGHSKFFLHQLAAFLTSTIPGLYTNNCFIPSKKSTRNRRNGAGHLKKWLVEIFVPRIKAYIRQFAFEYWSEH